MIAATYNPPGLTILLDHFDWAGQRAFATSLLLIAFAQFFILIAFAIGANTGFFEEPRIIGEF